MSSLSNAGITIHVDAVGVEHLRYGAETRTRARRFSRLRKHAARQPHDRAGICAARLISLDAVPPSELAGALAARPYRHGHHTFVEWQQGEETPLDRRALNSLTVLSAWPAAEAVEQEVQECLQQMLKVPGYQDVSSNRLLEQLEADLIAWGAIHLPRPLWAHVAGVRRMTPQPAHLLAMELSSQVPALGESTDRVEMEAASAQLLDATEGVASRDIDVLLIEEAVSAFSVRASESDKAHFLRWQWSLLLLQPRLESAGFVCNVVHAWLMDLAESGTVSLTGVPSTRARYARVGGGRLLRMLSTLPPHPRSWTAAQLESGYLTLMSDPSCKDLSGLGAAISAFQAFSVEVLGAPLINLGLHRLIPPPKPRAQIVPQHCIARAIDWLDKAATSPGGDRLQCQMAALQILMAGGAPFRPNELGHLRLRNVFACTDGSVEVEIAPVTGENDLKTDAATRRFRITDPVVTARLLAWKNTRTASGFPSSAYLFSDAHQPHERYRPNATRSLILRTLKAATGDPSMTLYALRHTWVSNAMAQLLSTDGTLDSNRYLHVATEVGHVSPATTLHFYCHCYELALSAHLAAILQEEVVLTSLDAEVLLP